MLAKLRSNLTFANVASALALFVALSTGGAYAAHETIFSDDIVDGEVQNPDLGADSVSSAKIQAQAVTTGDLAPNSVTASRIPAEAVGTSEIAQGSVFNADLAPNSITDTRIGADAVGSSELKSDAVAAPEVALDSLTDADIGPDSIGSSELKFSAVGSPEVANDSLTQVDIGDFRHNDRDGQDTTVDGIPDTDTLDQFVEADNGETYTVKGSCDKTSDALIAAVTIEFTGGGMKVDSTAPGGQDNQTSVPPNETRLLLQVKATTDEYQAGTFAATQPIEDNNSFSGNVAVFVRPATNACEYQYTRFGP